MAGGIRFITEASIHASKERSRWQAARKGESPLTLAEMLIMASVNCRRAALCVDRCRPLRRRHRRPSGKENFERGAEARRRAYADLPAMRGDDRPRDKQPQPDALCCIGPSSGKRLENGRLRGKRDRIPPIVHTERDALVRTIGLETDRTSIPMLDRIAQYVRDDLRKSIGVPFTSEVPARAEMHDRLWMCGLHLQKDLFTELLEICADELEGNGAAEPGAREIQQIADHALHALCAVEDARRYSPLTLIVIRRRSQ